MEYTRPSPARPPLCPDLPPKSQVNSPTAFASLLAWPADLQHRPPIRPRSRRCCCWVLVLLSPHPKVGRPLYSSRTYTRRLQLQSTPYAAVVDHSEAPATGPDHSAGRRSLVAAPLTPTRGRGATSLSTPPFNAVSETGGRNRGLGSCGPPLRQCECESRKATGPLPRWSRRVTWTPVTRPLPARQVPAIFWARHAALRRWPARRDTAREAAKR